VERSWLYYASSVFAFHNETVDIWTHMTASIYHICVFVGLFGRSDIGALDRVVLLIR
jgi:predicted membrane channel-forming protein YqfA (hemolysin III family)